MSDVNKQMLDALKELRDAYQEYMGLPACKANAAIAAAEQAQQAEPATLCATCARADVNCPVYPQQTASCVEHRPAAQQQAEPVALTNEQIEELWWGELDNRSLGCIRNIIAAAQPPAVAEPSATDDDLEEMAKRLGMRWDGDFWAIEDADFHPFMRAMLAAAQKGGA